MTDQRKHQPSAEVVLLGFAALLNDVSSDIVYPLLRCFCRRNSARRHSSSA